MEKGDFCYSPVGGYVIFNKISAVFMSAGLGLLFYLFSF